MTITSIVCAAEALEDLATLSGTNIHWQVPRLLCPGEANKLPDQWFSKLVAKH